MKNARRWLIAAAVLALSACSAGAAPATLPLQVPLNQALVLTGGESNNPREYDPATTHGTGDKLVYSGLVAFDPHLNLIPDLAETWSVSGDGLTYTFTLRSNATFHDG